MPGALGRMVQSVGPGCVLAPAFALATWLTVVAMAALGLLVDLRVVAEAQATRHRRRRAVPDSAGRGERCPHLDLEDRLTAARARGQWTPMQPEERR